MSRRVYRPQRYHSRSYYNRGLTPRERVMAKVLVQDSAECWLWLGATNGEGYGKFHDWKGSKRAHKIVWELLRGPVPHGLVLDHLCCNRLCVNPDHLEPVTPKENRHRRGREWRVGTRPPLP